MYAKESINFTSTMQVKFSVILSEVCFILGNLRLSGTATERASMKKHDTKINRFKIDTNQ